MAAEALLQLHELCYVLYRLSLMQTLRKFERKFRLGAASNFNKRNGEAQNSNLVSPSSHHTAARKNPNRLETSPPPPFPASNLSGRDHERDGDHAREARDHAR